jgi:hypothetical protein
VDADGLRGCAVLLEVMAGPGVHGRRRSTISSWRKPVAGKHSPRGVIDRWLGLQVVATRRTVGQVPRIGSMEEEGSWAVVLVGEPRRRQRVEQGAEWREGGGGERGKSVARCAPVIVV